MENMQNMNVAGIQGSLMMKTLDRRDLTKSSNDIMARRLKNRERQRRYRARKRLEADLKKSIVVNHSTTLQADVQENGNLNNCVDRVYCKRNWKKDARSASLTKGREDMNSSANPTLTLTTESQAIFLPGNKADSQAPIERESHPSFSVIGCETNKTKLGRRDWKAEARNKKS